MSNSIKSIGSNPSEDVCASIGSSSVAKEAHGKEETEDCWYGMEHDMASQAVSLCSFDERPPVQTEMKEQHQTKSDSGSGRRRSIDSNSLHWSVSDEADTEDIKKALEWLGGHPSTDSNRQDDLIAAMIDFHIYKPHQASLSYSMDKDKGDPGFEYSSTVWELGEKLKPWKAVIAKYELFLLEYEAKEGTQGGLDLIAVELECTEAEIRDLQMDLQSAKKELNSWTTSASTGEEWSDEEENLEQ